MVTCLDKETAAALISGELSVSEAEACAVHIDRCQPCRRMVEETTKMIDDVRRDLQLIDPPTEVPIVPSPEEIKRRAGQLTQVRHESDEPGEFPPDQGGE